MEDEVWIIVLLALLIIGILLLLCVVTFFVKGEQRFVNQIQKMLDDAISGKFQDELLNESKISAIENSMWRYLCDKEVASRRLVKEKQQIQTHISDISHQTIIPIANIILSSPPF